MVFAKQSYPFRGPEGGGGDLHRRQSSTTLHRKFHGYGVEKVTVLSLILSST